MPHKVREEVTLLRDGGAQRHARQLCGAAGRECGRRPGRGRRRHCGADAVTRANDGPQPARETGLRRNGAEALVEQHHGAEVVPVADGAANALVQRAERLLRVPLRAADGRERAGAGAASLAHERVLVRALELDLRVKRGRKGDADDNNNAAVRVAEVNALGDLAAAHGEQDRAVAPRVLASQRRKQCIERRGER